MPKFSSYVKRDGSVETAYNLNKWRATEAVSDPTPGAQGYKEFVLKIRKEQPMLYNTLISDGQNTNNPLTSAGINDANSLTKYISDHTYNLIANGATPIALLEEEGTPTTKKGIFSKSK